MRLIARAQARPREGRARAHRPRRGDVRRRRRTRSSPGSRRARRATSSHFAPALERVLELQQRYIACFDGTGEFAHPYDILLDDYEPGLTTEELRGLFAHIQAGARPARLGGRGGGGGRPRLPGPLPDGGAAARSRTSCCTPSATTPSTGAWTRRCTRSRARWRTPTCGSRRAGRRTTSRWRSTPACTSSGTGCTRRRCRPAPLPDDARRRRRARHARVPEPAVGEPRRPRASRSASGSCRSCSATSGDPFDAWDVSRALPLRQPGAALADPDRGRRDDLQPAHRAAVRARAGAGRGAAQRRRPPGRLGRGDAPAARAGDAVGARGRPAGHPLGHRDDRLLPDVHDREPDGRAAVAGAAHRPAGHRRLHRRGRLRAAARVAARQHPPARPQVRLARAAAPRDRGGAAA